MTKPRKRLKVSHSCQVSKYMNNDITESILAMLPLVDRVRFERVSKNWSQIVSECFQHVKNLPDTSYKYPYVDIAFKCPSLTKFDFSKVRITNPESKKRLFKLHDHCPNIVRFDGIDSKHIPIVKSYIYETYDDDNIDDDMKFLAGKESNSQIKCLNVNHKTLLDEKYDEDINELYEMINYQVSHISIIHDPVEAINETYYSSILPYLRHIEFIYKKSSMSCYNDPVLSCRSAIAYLTNIFLPDKFNIKKYPNHELIKTNLASFLSNLESLVGHFDQSMFDCLINVDSMRKFFELSKNGNIKKTKHIAVDDRVTNINNMSNLLNMTNLRYLKLTSLKNNKNKECLRKFLLISGSNLRLLSLEIDKNKKCLQVIKSLKFCSSLKILDIIFQESKDKDNEDNIDLKIGQILARNVSSLKKLKILKIQNLEFQDQKIISKIIKNSPKLCKFHPYL